MALLIFNITAAPITITVTTPNVVVPASPAAPSRGPSINVTSECRPNLTVDPAHGIAGGLSGANYVTLAGLVGLEFEWTSDPEYLTTGLTVNGPTPGAHALVGTDHTVSGLTTGHVLQATGAGTFGFGVSALDTLVALKKKIVNVDAGRVDVYTEDGSVERPYKTIAAALLVAVAGDTIHVFPTLTPYVENVTLPAGVSMEGGGCVGAYTIINGNFVTSAGGAVTLKNLHFGLNVGVGSLTINSSGCDLRDCYCDGTLTNNSTNPVTFINLTVATTGVPALVSSGTGALECLFCRFTSTGDVPAISHTSGWLLLSNCEATSNRAAGPTLASFGGYATLTASQVVNGGGGIAVSLTNGATSPPNIIASLVAVGNVDVTGAVTFIDNLVFLGLGVLVGENILTTFHNPCMFIPTGLSGVQWAAVPGVPTTLADAINRIAVAVAAGAAGPIA